MEASDASDKPVAVLGAIAVGMYLVAIGLTPGHAPDSESPGTQIVRWAADHRTQLLASYLLFAAGLAVLVVFAAGLGQIIRRAEGKGGWLGTASVACVAGGSGIFGAGTALFMTVAYRPDTDPAVARALWDAGWLAYNTAGFAFVAWIGIVAVAALRHGALATWTAWIGIPVGAHQPHRPARGEGRKRRVLSARLVRAGRRPHLRGLAGRRLTWRRGARRGGCRCAQAHPSPDSRHPGNPRSPMVARRPSEPRDCRAPGRRRGHVPFATGLLRPAGARSFGRSCARA